jgi:hypothetical protein
MRYGVNMAGVRMDQPAFAPGSEVEMTWYPPDGARFDPDAYEDTVGTDTWLAWSDPEAGTKTRWPARVTSVRVAGDGSYAAARLEVLDDAHGEADIAGHLNEAGIAGEMII